MLEIKVEKDATLVEGITEDKEGMSAFVATENGDMIGYSLFVMGDDKVIDIKSLHTSPKDFSLADGLGRATINYADYYGNGLFKISGMNDEMVIFAAMLGVRLNEEYLTEDIFDPSGSCGMSASGGCSGSCDSCGLSDLKF
ncbi:MAG: hypothetical protein GX928_01275 [Ruminococcaceae bacterium]|nr:hypothetical protein [Oscillospiraceae bacterium]